MTMATTAMMTVAMATRAALLVRGEFEGAIHPPSGNPATLTPCGPRPRLSSRSASSIAFSSPWKHGTSSTGHNRSKLWPSSSTSRCVNSPTAMMRSSGKAASPPT